MAQLHPCNKILCCNLFVFSIFCLLLPSSFAATLDIEQPIHFLTPGGDSIKLPSGIYDVDATDTGIKLLQKEEDPSSSILVEAQIGSHDHLLDEATVHLKKDDQNPDVYHLALLLPSGMGLEATGSVSGIYPRGLKMVMLKKSTKQFTRIPLQKVSRAKTRLTLNLPKPCSKEKLDSVRAKATKRRHWEHINCQLTLKKKWKITKTLIFEGAKANGVTLDCQGATLGDGSNKELIQVRSKENKNNPMGTWERPQHVTIKNCHIIGAVRVWGMGRNGEATHVRTSSRTANHVTRIRNNAPKNITFDNITITGTGKNIFYVGPGTTYTKLLNSELKGKSTQVAIYLGMESAFNTIKNNTIHASTGNRVFEEWDRPQINIDGSSHNTIINNYFSNLSHGGIYLYRNCGEGGTIRHSPPSHNTIINNIFYYNKYKGSNPSVYLGSRDRSDFIQDTFGFCQDDKGYPWGSSKNDKDFARHNVIMQNQIYKRSLKDMIKTNSPKINSPNYIGHNKVVTSSTVVKNRKAGCYFANGSRDFILHGKKFTTIKDLGRSTCLRTYSCTDGVLKRSGNSDCRVKKVGFSCQVKGNNNGCRKTFSCPSGKKMVGAVGACNLEYGTVSSGTLRSVPSNVLKVVRTSDNVQAGKCYMGSYSIQKGKKEIAGVKGLRNITVGCKEHDKNGGDCHIKGTLYCK